MIVFRQTDRRYPFLWTSPAQPPGRWHAEAEGPAHYFADTPDGAWAEFIRHEEITDPGDLGNVTRTLWAVEIDDGEAMAVTLDETVLTGAAETWPACQAHARELLCQGRRTGSRRAAGSSPRPTVTVSSWSTSIRIPGLLDGGAWRVAGRRRTCCRACGTSGPADAVQLLRVSYQSSVISSQSDTEN